jgi:hypothetical protein
VKRFARHLLCEACWGALYDRTPVTCVGDPPRPCCGCGELTESGIFVREESDVMLCKGAGPNHTDDDP